MNNRHFRTIKEGRLEKTVIRQLKGENVPEIMKDLGLQNFKAEERKRQSLIKFLISQG